MALTLKNYAKQLTKDLMQLAEKNTVRECDETAPGHFVAYVDEGSESFDVSLTVLSNDEIGNTACDCKNNSAFCRHKTALLLHIAKDKKVKTTVKLKKKGGQAEALLEEAEFSGLKEWVKTLIEKNKDIELAFIHHFSVKSQQYTAEEVVKLIKDAIKAAGCNRKSADATQIKKLVELWSGVLQPVVAHYQLNVMDEKAFQNFHTLVEQCLQFQSGINSSSTRIAKYIEDILQKAEAPLNNLQNDEAWYRAVGFYIANIPDEANNTIRMHYLLYLQNVIGACSAERREKVIDLLARQFEKNAPERAIKGAIYTKTIFGIIETYNLLPKYYRLFKPLYFDNAFNEKLIAFLIENNHLALAEKYCEEQIKGNYREEYNVLYLKLLKKIYTAEKDEIKLAAVLTALFPYSYDFGEYLFIADHLSPDDKKKWRTKILAKARNASRGYGDNGALEFCFRLADHEKNYKKMMEYIDSYTPYDMILKYFGQMVSTDKTKLIDAIFKKSDNDWMPNSATVQKEAACFPELFELLKKYDTGAYWKVAMNHTEKRDAYFNRPNRFVAYLKEKLNK